MNDYQDEVLECQDPEHDHNTADAEGNPAPREFNFSADEARFYEEKGFDKPRRCPACRAAKKKRFDQKQMHDAVCASCGNQTQVPFEPSQGRPVYCEDCFRRMKQAQAA